MIQKTIRDWGGVEFTTTEGAEQQTEWNDRTVYAVDGYNSIAELGAATQAIEVKTDFITVTQAVNLDTIESDTATNKTNADASKVITDFITITQAVNLDTVESDTATNNAKTSYTDASQVATNKTNADASKIKTDLLTVTGAIDLDSNVGLLDAQNTFTGTNNTFKGVTSDQTGAGANIAVKLSGVQKIILGTKAGGEPLFQFSDNDLYFQSNDGDNVIFKNATSSNTISEIIALGDTALLTQEIGLLSHTNGEPTGSDKVVNMVSLTQAEYNAGTPVATTFYVITDA